MTETITLPPRVWAVDGYNCHYIEGLHCRIWMQARPAYCDRGAWLAHVEPKLNVNPRDFYLDAQDGWPRYYFDLYRAKAEIEAWLLKRKQVV